MATNYPDKPAHIFILVLLFGKTSQAAEVNVV